MVGLFNFGHIGCKRRWRIVALSDRTCIRTSIPIVLIWKVRYDRSWRSCGYR